jgi:hypothetical protein
VRGVKSCGNKPVLLGNVACELNLDICADQKIFPSCYTDLVEVQQNFDTCKNVEENAGHSAEEHLAQSNGISFKFIWL